MVRSTPPSRQVNPFAVPIHNGDEVNNFTLFARVFATYGSLAPDAPAFTESHPYEPNSPYSASKAAVACMTECLAEELKDTTVRCNCLCLGAVDTAMLREAFPHYQAQVTPKAMGSFIAEFVLNGHKLLNGKVLPVSLSTP